MKKNILLIILCFFFSFIKAQEGNQLNEMINESLIAYLDNINKYVEKGIIVKDYPEKLHIVIDVYPLNFLFNDSILRMKLNYISLTNLNPYKQKLKKGVSVILLDGIKLRDNQLIITFSSRYAKLKKGNNLHLIISDWGNFTYEYSCEKQKWILTETKYGGI